MTVGLIGNPNSGKTTLFNALTGATAHVGNWAGVTVEKKTGVYKKANIEIVDLPGIYSLSPYTPEEIVSRDFLTEGNPDCIVNVVDATNLERNLYLTTQVLETDIPVVVALNMTDALTASGDKIDIDALAKKIGVPVVPISALKRENIHELMRFVQEAQDAARLGTTPLEHGALQKVFDETVKECRKQRLTNPVFHAVKLIEGDETERSKFPSVAELADKLKENVDTGVFEGDFEGAVAEARYGYISVELNVLTRAEKRPTDRTDRADSVLTHKVWGIPIFVLIMFAIFHLTFSENLLFIGHFIPQGTFDIPIIGTDAINSPGVMLQSAIEWLTGTVAGGLNAVMPAGTWYTSLVVDGLWSGLSSVLSFIPQIMLLFLFLSILEDSGYMARVAFIMDRAFRKFGLSGKAFLPLLMCFGCAVPGIMATRTLESEGERKRAIYLTPFFSCGAKLPIWAAFAGVFANAYAGLNAEVIVFFMYFIGIAIALIAAIILKKTGAKGETSPFIMELPAYRLPQAKSLGLHLWDKLKHYLLRAGTVIAGAIVVLWFLSTFNFEWQMVTDTGESILGSLGKMTTFLFVPLGFGMGADGWKFVVAMLTGLIAKEMVVASMGTLSGMSDFDADASDFNATPLAAMMLTIGGTLGALDVSIPAMFSFMTFNLLSVPCMAAVAAARVELGSRRAMWKAIGFWLLTAYVTSAFVFWFGVLCAYRWWLGLVSGVVLFTLALMFAVLISKGKIKFQERRPREKKTRKPRACVSRCCDRCAHRGSCLSGQEQSSATKTEREDVHIEKNK